MHYVVFGSGQEHGQVHGVFDAEADAVRFCDELAEEFYTLMGDSRLALMDAHLTVEQWDGGKKVAEVFRLARHDHRRGPYQEHWIHRWTRDEVAWVRKEPRRADYGEGA